MAFSFQLTQAPFSSGFLDRFSQLSGLVFTGIETPPLRWRLEKMPDVTVFTASVDNTLVAFKAGYASTYNRYYSWLGGVAPSFQKQGLAKILMRQQHEWLVGSQYQLVETHVLQSNTAMVSLNHSGSLVIIGYFVKQGQANFIMQKQLAS